MTYRCAFKLEWRRISPPFAAFGFVVAEWRVVKCWRLIGAVQNAARPVAVRKHDKNVNSASRLLILTHIPIEPGTLVKPLDVLKGYLASQTVGLVIRAIDPIVVVGHQHTLDELNA